MSDTNETGTEQTYQSVLRTVETLKDRVSALETENQRLRTEGTENDTKADRAVADLKRQFEETRSLIASGEGGEFATTLELDRVKEDVKLLLEDKTSNVVANVDGDTYSEGTDSFPRGLVVFVIETYFREELQRYGREIDAKRKLAE